MNYNDETYPFAYKKSNNYFAKTFREINETLELTDKEIKTLIIFALLRIIDLFLTYIFFNRENAYYPLKFIDCFLLVISFIFSSSVYHNKDNVKQRATMLSIFFNFTFLIFDVISFVLYFAFNVKNIFILLSIIVNGIWLFKIVTLIYKITLKFLKVLKHRKKIGYEKFGSSNLRKSKIY